MMSDQFVEMPYYDRLPDSFQRETFEKFYGASREIGRAMMTGTIVNEDVMRILRPKIEEIRSLIQEFRDKENAQ